MAPVRLVVSLPRGLITRPLFIPPARIILSLTSSRPSASSTPRFPRTLTTDATAQSPDPKTPFPGHEKSAKQRKLDRKARRRRDRPCGNKERRRREEQSRASLMDNRAEDQQREEHRGTESTTNQQQDENSQARTQTNSIDTQQAEEQRKVEKRQEKKTRKKMKMRKSREPLESTLITSVKEDGVESLTDRLTTSKSRRAAALQVHISSKPNPNAASVTPSESDISAIIRSRRAISQVRFEEAKEELRLLKTPLGRFQLRVKSLWQGLARSLGYLPQESSGTDMPLGADRSWAFAERPLYFPNRPDWPPRLPTYKDLPNGGLSPTPPGPRPTFYSNRTPRDIAAAALNVQRYGVSSLHLVNITSGRIVTEDDEAHDEDILRLCARGNSIASLPWEDRLWLTDANPRLEYFGDALVKAIVLRALWSRPTRISRYASREGTTHLTMNETFVKLYELAGLNDLRIELARDLFIESAKSEARKRGTLDTFQVDEEKLASIPEPQLSARPADLFECYLAYLDLVHGSDVAEKWFVSLAEPWLKKVDDNWPILETSKGFAEGNNSNNPEFTRLKGREILNKMVQEAKDARRKRSVADKRMCAMNEWIAERAKKQLHHPRIERGADRIEDP